MTILRLEYIGLRQLHRPNGKFNASCLKGSIEKNIEKNCGRIRRFED